jgi:hypothetical protein
MTQQPFDPSSRAERAKLIQEEKLMNTRQALHSVIEPAAGGRFATALRQQINTVEYPWLPSGPWTGPQPPPEENLGFSVEEMPVMGEPFEAERAANLLAAATSLGGSGSDADPSSNMGPATLADRSSEQQSPPVVGIDPSSSSTAAEFVPASSLARQTPDPFPDLERRGSGSTLRSSFRRFG